MNVSHGTSLLGIALVLMFPSHLCSMPIERFDRMPIEVQAEFIATMVDATEKTLRESGEAAKADTVARLFNEVKAGDTLPIGLIVLEENIARARVFDLERVQKDPGAQRVQVEQALFLTLKKLGAEVPRETGNSVLAIFRAFHPMTYAEFQSMPVAAQRRYLFRMARVGLPAYRLRVRYERAERKEPKIDPRRDKEVMQLEDDVTRRNFPAETGTQPGFDAVAGKIRSQSASHPNDTGPFYELNMYVMGQASAEMKRRIREMESKTYQVPNRR